MTADYAGMAGSMQERYRLGYIGLPARCKDKCVHLGWALPIFRFLTTPQQQPKQQPALNESEAVRAASAVVNSGQSARYFDNYLDCTSSAVPAEADIIFIDGVNGMSPMVGNHRKPTEKLLRRLLSLPHQPAIVQLHWIDWCACLRSCFNEQPLRAHRHRNGSCYTAEGLRQSYEVATRREEQQDWAALARYYQLSVLSMRRAFHPLANGSGLPSAYGGSNPDDPSSLTSDGLHPKACRGSWQRCRYVLLIASLVNTFFADVMADRFGQPQPGEGEDPLPVSFKPFFTRASEHSVPIERCFGWGGTDRRVQPATSHVEGWRQSSLDTALSFDPPAWCVDGQRHQRLSAQGQASTACPKPKPGFTAFAPGSQAVFELPVSPDSHYITSSRASHVKWNATLSLEFLSSYEGMGIAVVNCDHGCECDPVTLDGHRTAATGVHADEGSSLISIWERATWAVVLHDPICAVRIVLQNRTHSGRTKFKIGSMTLRWAAAVRT